MEDCAEYIQPLDVGSFINFDILLDWLFVDWEFGYGIREWDKKIEKDTILKRLNAFQKINTSKTTMGYHWVSIYCIQDIIEALLETSAKKIHSWVTISTHKQVKRGGHVPFQYSTQQVC